MENIKTHGVYFHEDDIKEIVEKYLEWAEVVEGQVFCADNVMSEHTPIGTSIIVSVDGIKCDAGSDIVRLVMSSGIYELPVKTAHANDEMNIRFAHTIPVPGTYGRMVDGVLDILTDEEKEFKQFVIDALGYRDDEYANMFRRDNIRNIGGRGLILLEKIKEEIENDAILSSEEITPAQLIAVFIEMTDKYLNACKSAEELTIKRDELAVKHQETFVEGSKPTKKLARDIELLNHKIESNIQIGDFCLNVINVAVMPILDAVVER